MGIGRRPWVSVEQPYGRAAGRRRTAADLRPCGPQVGPTAVFLVEFGRGAWFVARWLEILAEAGRRRTAADLWPCGPQVGPTAAFPVEFGRGARFVGRCLEILAHSAFELLHILTRRLGSFGLRAMAMFILASSPVLGGTSSPCLADPLPAACLPTVRSVGARRAWAVGLGLVAAVSAREWFWIRVPRRAPCQCAANRRTAVPSFLLLRWPPRHGAQNRCLCMKPVPIGKPKLRTCFTAPSSRHRGRGSTRRQSPSAVERRPLSACR